MFDLDIKTYHKGDFTMDAINIIDVKLDEITNKINRERKNIKLTQKQCEQMSRTLAKTSYKK